MVHTPTTQKDIATAIVTALNGTTVQGGVVSATLAPGGQVVFVKPHSDLANTANASFEIVVH